MRVVYAPACFTVPIRATFAVPTILHVEAATDPGIEGGPPVAPFSNGNWERDTLNWYNRRGWRSTTGGYGRKLRVYVKRHMGTLCMVGAASKL